MHLGSRSTARRLGREIDFRSVQCQSLDENWTGFVSTAWWIVISCNICVELPHFVVSKFFQLTVGVSVMFTFCVLFLSAVCCVTWRCLDGAAWWRARGDVTLTQRYVRASFLSHASVVPTVAVWSSIGSVLSRGCQFISLKGPLLRTSRRVPARIHVFRDILISIRLIRTERACKLMDFDVITNQNGHLQPSAPWLTQNILSAKKEETNWKHFRPRIYVPSPDQNYDLWVVQNQPTNKK